MGNSRLDDRAYRIAAAKFREEQREANTPCHLCGQPIEYDAPPDHPDAYNLDHYHPRSTHPHLAHDMANARASHASCNKARGNRAATYPLGTTTRKW